MGFKWEFHVISPPVSKIEDDLQMCITLNPHVPLMTRGLLVTAQIIPNVRTHGSCSISQDPKNMHHVCRTRHVKLGVKLQHVDSKGFTRKRR